MSRLRPKVVLWWGIGVVAGSVVFSYGVAAISAATFSGGPGSSATALDQAILGILVTAIQAVNSSAPFIGAALIGAGIVMFYIAKNVLPPAQQAVVDEEIASGKHAAGAD